MLENLLEKLKEKIPPNIAQKFPFLSKGKSAAKNDEDVEETSVDEADSEDDKTKKVNIKDLKAGEEEAEEVSQEEQDEGSDKEKSKKNKVPTEAQAKRSKIIKLVVVLGLIYMGAEEFLMKEEVPPEQPAPAEQVQRKKGTRKRAASPQNVEQKSIAEKNQENSGTQAAQTEVPSEVPSNVQVEVPVTQPLDVANNNHDSQPAVETGNNTESQVASNELVEMPSSTGGEVVPDAAVTIEEPTATTGQAEEIKINFDDPTASQTTSELSDRSVAQEGSKNLDDNSNSTLENSMQKVVDEVKKNEKPDYVAPPNYENMGRGLVYNCKEKYWTCIDKDSYFQCSKNLKWSESTSSKTECATVNVYSSSDDCQTIQIYNINTNAKTDFCK